MVKRLLSCTASEIKKLTKAELKQGIKASEGRIICTEMVVSTDPVAGNLTNAEVARAFGADLMLLNGFDVFNPQIKGLVEAEKVDPIRQLKELVARPIGINLEPVDIGATMNEELLVIPDGRMCSEKTLKRAESLGVDFICLTGNPGTGVTNKEIVQAVSLAKKYFSGLIIAGKMHGAGVAEPIVSIDSVKLMIEKGADIILLPAVGTIPGWSDQELTEVVMQAKGQGALTMSAIGTSQESAEADTIRQLAIRNKICGVDIQHIGDAGYAGLAPVENIYALSVAIRGMRHTINRMALSVKR